MIQNVLIVIALQVTPKSKTTTPATKKKAREQAQQAVNDEIIKVF